jgi:imidazolonepropionase-like amidohydrolase
LQVTAARAILRLRAVRRFIRGTAMIHKFRGERPLTAKVLAASLATTLALGGGPAAAEGSRTLRYSILSNARVAGTETDTYDANGALTSEFEFNDRGRGPKIKASYAFGADGLPTRIDVSGVNYLKAPVDEHLATEGGRVTWRSSAERGEARSRGFYVSNDGTGGAEMAALVRALARHPGDPLPLLPAGEARLESVADTVVQSHGQQIHVREFAITGLGLVPVTVWLDDNGDFFAQPGSWFAALRAGWEDANDTLTALQDKAEDARYARLAKSLARRPAGAVAIEHVRLFDSERALTIDDQTVVVRGARIMAVGPSASTSVPADAEHVDGRGRTLLPGLFDMHMHASPSDGLLDVASGVTGARDMGNDIADLKRMTTQWDSGAAIGPQVWKAGLIDGNGPYQAPTGAYADTPAEAVTAVDRYADLGYVQIKLYSSLKPELVPAIVAEAHRRGLRVSGHVPDGMIAADFVRQGADELQHINFVFLNFLAPKVKDTRTPERFTAVGEYAAGVDLESQAVKDFIALLLEHHTTVDVTLNAFEGMFTGRPGKVSPEFGAVLERLPAQVRRQAFAGGLPVTAANDQRYRDSYEALLKMTRKLYDAGVPILVGTDSLAGLMLHRELELEVLAGIAPSRALQNATLVAARVLKQDAELGSVRVGKRADLLLVEGDPTTQISDIRRGRLVMKAGVVYDPTQLYAAVGVGPSK